MTQLIQEAASAGELKAEQLLCFPCLLLAPNWFGMVYNEVLNPAAPVSTGDLLKPELVLFSDRHITVSIMTMPSGGGIPVIPYHDPVTSPGCLKPERLAPPHCRLRSQDVATLA